MLRTAAAVLAALLVQGCATIQEHPRATAVVVGIVAAGAIAAHQHHRHPEVLDTGHCFRPADSPYDVCT
jgi:hypothetical protein